MPYRRLPKTDAARLKALKTVLDNNDVYTANNHIIDWKTLNLAQQYYDKLYDSCQQYKICMGNQVRNNTKYIKYQKNASMFVSHFIQVLFLSMQRGEIKESYKSLYGLTVGDYSIPNIKSAEGLVEWGEKIIAGEKERIKKGGMPIYNPTIAKVSVHYDIFKEAYDNQKSLQSRTGDALAKITASREAIDDVILSIWNQVEKNFEAFPPEKRFNECRKYGVVYYYRRKEPHIY